MGWDQRRPVSGGIPLGPAWCTHRKAWLWLHWKHLCELLKIYQCISITFAMVMRPDLPEEWNLLPPGPASQFVGDQWGNNEQSAVLQVPSIIIPGESNFLINSNHPDFAKMNIGAALDYPYDSRLDKA